MVKGMRPSTVTNKPASVMVFLINTAGGGGEERGTFVFRCESADAAAELKAKIEEFL
jgi:hypothetical protein